MQIMKTALRMERTAGKLSQAILQAEVYLAAARHTAHAPSQNCCRLSGWLDTCDLLVLSCREGCLAGMQACL